MGQKLARALGNSKISHYHAKCVLFAHLYGFVGELCCLVSGCEVRCRRGGREKRKSDVAVDRSARSLLVLRFFLAPVGIAGLKLEDRRVSRVGWCVCSAWSWQRAVILSLSSYFSGSGDGRRYNVVKKGELTGMQVRNLLLPSVSRWCKCLTQAIALFFPFIFSGCRYSALLAV
jgi:hypothetical protein